MSDSALDALHTFSYSDIVTNLQLVTDAGQETIFQQQFDQALQHLIDTYAEEFDRVGKRTRKYEDFTDTEMENFVIGRGIPGQVSKVNQYIRAQETRVKQKQRNVEEQLRASSPGKQREALTEELVYLLRQSLIWSQERFRLSHERI